MPDAAARERALRKPVVTLPLKTKRERILHDALTAEQERTRQLEEALRETDRALRLERGGGTPLKPLEYIALAKHNRTFLDGA